MVRGRVAAPPRLPRGYSAEARGDAGDRQSETASRRRRGGAAPSRHGASAQAWTDVDARDVVRGDLVLVRDGESAPADFVVRSCDDFEVSLKHVTGETAPKRPKPGDEVYLGAVVLRGSAQGRVVAIGAETALAQRIAEGAWPPR